MAGGCRRVARSRHDDDADAKARKIPLILDALIDGEERIELAVGEFEQGAVLDSCPSHILHGFRFMTRQFVSEPLRHTFIEKQAHERQAASCVQARPRPASS